MSNFDLQQSYPVMLILGLTAAVFTFLAIGFLFQAGTVKR